MGLMKTSGHWFHCLRALVALSLILVSLRLFATEPLQIGVGQGDQIIDLTTLQQTRDVVPGDTLGITVSDHLALQFTVARAHQTPSGNTVLSAVTERGERLLMVVGSDSIEGFLQHAEQRHRIAGTLARAVLISPDSRQSKLPPERTSSPPKRPIRQFAPDVIQRALPPQSARPKASSAVANVEAVKFPNHQLGSAQIDVLIYFDDDMAESPSVIADQMVAITNQAMIDSDIDIELRMVGLTGVPISNQTTQSDVLTDMFYGDGPFSNIERDRADSNADLVIAIRDRVPDDDSSCGIAYIGVDQGFPWRRLYVSSVHWNPLAPGETGNFCDDTTFAHEVGHILGSMHERRLYEEGDTGAYEFSFGHYRNGWFKTIMSYGKEEEKNFFSNPNIICADVYGNDIPCGVVAGDPSSADNASGFTNTRHMVAGYFSDQLTHELIVHHRHEGSCDTPAGKPGVLRAHSVMNETQYDIEIREFSVLTDAGEVLSESYTGSKSLLTIGEEREFGFERCIAEDQRHPYGDEYVESWILYADPLTGDLYESIHIPWDAEYTGGYARISLATSPGGVLEGHSAVFAKLGESQAFRFMPESGYRLADIAGSCSGGVKGNQFVIEAVQHDCTIEAYFEIGEGGDGGDTGTGGNTDGGGDTNGSDTEPPEGPEEMFGALLGTVVNQVAQEAGGTGMSPPDAAARDADVASDVETSPHPIPVVTPVTVGLMTLLIWLVGYLRLKITRGERSSRSLEY